ncbi:hypothetical protein [Brucella intermedia]|uniref:Lipoprotein n=1 Tax=Brucella intermedia M86 TaxID=1234597 RepID=M5JTZ8_9HYPH|nr:hypothetical protein [Brucella intermedia]ELT46641.1 hypothetical protein D584_23698 [Brucella intermedia M86]
MKISRAGVRLPFILSATVFLTGCLAPVTIDADITTDGYDYTLRVESTLADPRAAMAAAEGRLSAQDDENARLMAANDADLPGFERFEYLGDGRFAVVVNLSGTLEAAGQGAGFPNTRRGTGTDNYLRIERAEDGTIEISSPEIPARNLAQLEALPFRPSGEVRVTPAPTDRVVEHNADRTPAIPDRAYVWTLGSWEDRISIRIAPQDDSAER